MSERNAGVPGRPADPPCSSLDLFGPLVALLASMPVLRLSPNTFIGSVNLVTMRARPWW